MKERIIRVFIVFTIFVSVVIGVFNIDDGLYGYAFLSIITGFIIVSSVQYIFISEWNPLHLFKKD